MQLLPNKAVLRNLLIVTIILFGSDIAQVSITSDGSFPDSSAMLEIKSTTKGFLLPRLTTVERDGIVNPAEGLAIYNIDFKTIEAFTGILWSSPVAEFVCGNQVMDIDSNIYNTILIGSQCWMKENLTTTKLNDGAAILNVTEAGDWQTSAVPSYCWWGNDSVSYAALYGALYNWPTVETGILCPAGWHVPSDDEWKTLEAFIGLPQDQLNLTAWRGTNEGAELKNETGWNLGGHGNNNFGFSALPASLRSPYTGFGPIGQNCYWWSSSEYDAGSAWDRGLSYTHKIWRSNTVKNYGFGIRCLKD